jgi:hypothetical protein
METSTRFPFRLPARAVGLALAAAAVALAAVLAISGPALADTGDGPSVVLAAEERERRPIAPTQRDQFGLVLYAFMVVSVIAGVATMRRQLKGERPQTDGEFRWR